MLAFFSTGLLSSEISAKLGMAWMALMENILLEERYNRYRLDRWLMSLTSVIMFLLRFNSFRNFI